MKKLLSVVALFAIAFSAMSQPSVRNVTAATFSGTNAAAGGGGGGGCTPSYNDPNGTAVVSVVDNSAARLLEGSGQSLPSLALATNSASLSGLWFQNGVTLDGVNTYIIYTFSTAETITEDTFKQQTTTSQGTWKWQGSNNTNGWTIGVNDASIWTDIGGTFTMVSGTTTVHTTMSANTTAYTYYRELGMSGTTSFTPFIYQTTFKKCP